VTGLEILVTSEHCIQCGTTRTQVSDTQDKHLVSSNSTKRTKGRGHGGGEGGGRGRDTEGGEKDKVTERESMSVCLSVYIMLL